MEKVTKDFISYSTKEKSEIILDFVELLARFDSTLISKQYDKS